jgi:integrase
MSVQIRNGKLFYISIRYQRGKLTQHFYVPAVNPDNVKQKATDREKARFFDLKWRDLVEQGVDIKVHYAGLNPSHSKNRSFTPSTIKSLVEWIKPNALLYWKTPEKYPFPGFNKLVQLHGIKRLDLVKPHFAKLFRNELIEEGLEPNSINRYIEGLSKLWSIGRGEGWELGDPWTMPKLPTSKPDKQCLSREDERKLLLKALEAGSATRRDERGLFLSITELVPDDGFVAPETDAEIIERLADQVRAGLRYALVAAAVVCMVEGGMRPGEFMGRPLDDVNLLNRTVKIESWKQGAVGGVKVREVPMSHRTLPLYRALKELSTNGKIYPHKSFDVALANLCKACEVATHTPNELRHTAMQRMRELHVPESIVGQVTDSRFCSVKYGAADVNFVRNLIDAPQTMNQGVANVLQFDLEKKERQARRLA